MIKNGWIKSAVIAGMLAACSVANAGAAKRNAALYEQAAAHELKVIQAETEAETAEATARAQVEIAALNACQTAPDPTMCVMMNRMASALESMARGVDRPRTALSVPYERDMAAKFRDFMAPMAPLMGQAMSTYQGVEAIQSNERVAISRDQTFAGLANSALSANASVTGAAIANAQPVYNVGGDYTGGDRVTTTIGDDFTGGDRAETNISAGHDIVGGDQRIGDNVGRDQIGGDRTDNSGVIGDYNEYRFESPGPISNDGNCDGSGDSDCSDNSGGGP